MDPDLSGVETINDDVTIPVAGLGLGDRFADRYRIERCIGRGSMGTVYAAYDTVVGEYIALKLLMLVDEQSLEQFQREVRLARRVTHRNAARTFDLGEHRGVHFITMEFIDGESLRVALAQKGRMAPPEAMQLGRQLAMGLQAAHDVGVIHRDLKPANVLLAPDGRAVITDFGVASTMAEEAAGANTRARMAGTPMYMAPEQVEGKTIGPQVDIYALGVLLYEVLTGRPAFRGNNRVEIAMARLSRPPPDPRLVAPIPDALADLVMRCLARSPADRPENPQVVAQALAAQLALISEPPQHDTYSSTASGSDMELSVALTDQALAVMPFRYRGPAEDAHLAEVLTDELIDLLAMTRGLRVSASGATSQFKLERDARTVGRALGVDVIIDGTVMRGRDKIRIVVRLIDVDTGFQRSTERFEGHLEDVFDLQDRMAKRVAESLRLELSVLDSNTRVPREAAELYLRARKFTREADVSGRSLEEAARLFESALQLAPEFPLALAARAEAIVRRWFLPSDQDWRQAAEEAVEAALSGAAHLAETRLAAARLDVSLGRFSSAAHHLTSALEIAPTCAAAHEYLGLLQCEAGRSSEGVKHIELAHELDLSLQDGAFSVLRYHALRGNRQGWRKRMARMQLSPRFFPLALNLFEYRLSLWDGDLERARNVRWRTERTLPSGALDFIRGLQEGLDLERSDVEVHQTLRRGIEKVPSPRLRTGWSQLTVEVMAWRGAIQLALDELDHADAGGVLLDIDWFNGCPLLDPLREEPRFEQMLERVRLRAESIWRVDG